MPNKNYLRGRAKEYRITDAERKLGRLAFRSAGSHSPIDVVSIDCKTKRIFFIQSKPKSYSPNKIKKLLDENINLNGLFDVVFIVR